jgi:transcriptional regulator with XRE-family HTH domain
VCMNDAQRTARLAVAAEVRALMGRHQISQKRLAQELGVDQTGVSRRLRGGVPFNLDELVAISRFFNKPLTDLMPARLPNSGDAGLPEQQSAWVMEDEQLVSAA